MKSPALIFCFLLCIVTMSFAQGYFNKIVEFPDKSPNPIVLEIDNNNFIIGSINVIDLVSSTSIVTVNEYDFETDIFDFKGFKLGRNGLFVEEGEYYSFGDNFIDKSKLSFNIYNEDWTIENTFDYEPMYGRRAALGSNLIDGFIYGPSRDDFDSLNIEQVNLKKIALDGNEIWSKNFGVAEDDIFTWEIERADDGNILMSTRIEPPNFFGSQNRLYNIDTNGNIVWTFTTIEEPLIGTPCWVSTLNNDQILISRTLDYSQNWDHLLSGYYQYPPQFIWLDNDGKFLRDTIVLSETQNELIIFGHTSTEDGYTIVYGVNEPTGGSLQKGWMFKMDNDGEIIWNKTYLHPQFADRDHWIADIEILENGDVVCLGGISQGGEKSEIWLFKINGNGCFGVENCEDDLIYTSTNDINYKEGDLIYPNPSSGVFHLSNHEDLLSYKVVNLNGQIVTSNMITTNKVDLSLLDSGLYILMTIDKNKNEETFKILIEK